MDVTDMTKATAMKHPASDATEKDHLGPLDEEDGRSGDGGEEADVGPRRGAKKAFVRPTAQERFEHERTHVPFRAWCAHCVAGRGTRRRHPVAPSEYQGVPEISFDYAFLRNAAGAESAVVIVGKDRLTKMLMAHVVPNKGGNVEWATSQTCRDIQKCGYFSKVYLKSDQEEGERERLGRLKRCPPQKK